MAGKRITDLLAGTALAGGELIEISQLSATVRITAGTISAAAADNSFNDSANGFVAAGFAVGDRVNVVGFTGNVANNLRAGVIATLAAGKITIEGTAGDLIVDDAAGESVTIAKWTSRTASASDIAALAAGEVEEAPEDGSLYARKDGAWEEFEPGEGGGGGGGGGSGPWELIANVTLDAAGAFPPIDVDGFRTVKMFYSMNRSSNGDISAATFRFNGSAGGHYYSQNGYETNNFVGADGQIAGAGSGVFALFGSVDGVSTNNTNGEVLFSGLDGTTRAKGYIGINHCYRTSEGKSFGHRSSGFWVQAPAVHTINLLDNFEAGSSIQVVGIRADAIPQASGALIAGDVVLLEEREIPAGSTNIDFIGLISDKYRDYEIEISDLVLSAANSLYMRYSQDNGATFDASAIYTSTIVFWNEGTFGATGNEGTGQTRFNIGGTSFKGSTDAAPAIKLTLHNPGHIGGHKAVQASIYGQAGDDGSYIRLYGGRYRSNAAVNAFRIFPSGGTITSGTIRVYGKRRVTASSNVVVTAGAAFPAGPAVGQRFYRTDRKIEYVWDGARWLSTQVFSQELIPNSPAVTATSGWYSARPFGGQHGIWMERFDASSYRTAAGEWDVTLGWLSAANVRTVIATIDGAGDPSANWVAKGVAIGEALDAAAVQFETQLVEISGSAGAYATATLTYRLIG